MEEDTEEREEKRSMKEYFQHVDSYNNFVLEIFPRFSFQNRIFTMPRVGSY